LEIIQEVVDAGQWGMLLRVVCRLHLEIENLEKTQREELEVRYSLDSNLESLGANSVLHQHQKDLDPLGCREIQQD